MHAVEREIIEATNYKPLRKFSDRQDYLGSILNAILKLTDDDFNNLSDEAATWANAAVEAKNSKDDTLPDFDEGTEDEGSEDESASEDETDPIDDDPVDESKQEEAGEDEIDPETGEVLAEASQPEEATEVEEKPAKAKKQPPKKSGKKEAPKKVAKKEAKKEVKTGAKIGRPPHPDDDVVLDKWGAMEGSKTSQALALFEKGATAVEVKEAIGGTYYNALRKLVERGHHLEKDGRVITLVYRDPNAKPSNPKKPKAAHA